MSVGTLGSFCKGLVLKSELTVHTHFPFCPKRKQRMIVTERYRMLMEKNNRSFLIVEIR